MNKINVDRVQDINKWSPRPIILRFSEKFVYNEETGVFDSVIKCLVNNGVRPRSIIFPTERAFANALTYIEKNPKFINYELIKFSK